MGRRKTKKKLPAGAYRPKKWELPDIDAEGYIRDFMHQLVEDSKRDDSRPAIGTEAFDEILAEEEIYDDMEASWEQEVNDEVLPGFAHTHPRQSPFESPVFESALFPASREPTTKEVNELFDDYEGGSSDKYEVESDPDESAVEIRELLAAATYALSQGDADDLLESLDSLLDLLKARSVEFDSVEDWSRVLVEASAREREDEPVTEGERLVIGAINDLCVRLCQIIARDGNALRQVEWRELERVIATALSGIGFDVTLTPASKDGGKDVVATCLLRGRRLVYYLEIKHWRSAKRVNEDPIFDFVEVNACEGTDGGLFLSTSGFTTGVFSQLSELCQQRVRLGGKEKIVSLCQHFVRRSRGIWTTGQILPRVLFERTIG